MTRHQKRKIDETHVEVCSGLLRLDNLFLYLSNSYVKIYFLKVVPQALVCTFLDFLTYLEKCFECTQNNIPSLSRTGIISSF